MGKATAGNWKLILTVNMKVACQALTSVFMMTWGKSSYARLMHSRMPKNRGERGWKLAPLLIFPAGIPGMTNTLSI
jgi:hypothetical protein